MRKIRKRKAKGRGWVGQQRRDVGNVGFAGGFKAVVATLPLKYLGRIDGWTGPDFKHSRRVSQQSLIWRLCTRHTREAVRPRDGK